jgi:glycosyltransferase involved in cell wall biosynthesis
MLVSICVATYKRPEGLKKLLQGINDLCFDQIPCPVIDVIVVDNEASGSARRICDELFSSFRWRLQCFEEPKQGITYARNKAIESIQSSTDFVAFIDDDEVPDPAWLENLLVVQKKYDADVVSGPVIHDFEVDRVPDWITQLKLFDTLSYPDGHLVNEVFTCNVLVSARIFCDVGSFDHKFALTGGEDTDFFMRVYEAGYKMHWANRAITYEWVPKERTSVGWNLRRGYRSWGSYSYCEKKWRPSLGVRIARLAKAIALILTGVISFPMSLFLGKTQLIKSLLFIYRGAGTFSGLLDRQYQEYAEVAVTDG